MVSVVKLGQTYKVKGEKLVLEKVMRHFYALQGVRLGFLHKP